MTKVDVIKILAIMHSIYGQGKGSPEEVAQAWYLLLGKYDRDAAMAAVIRFMENDTRDWATLPAPGVIIAEIKKEESRRRMAVTEVYEAIACADKTYTQLSDYARELITPEQFAKWSEIDPEEFCTHGSQYKAILNERLPMLSEAQA